MSRKKQTLSPLTLAWEFIKLQLAGNILFFGTMIGFFIGDKILDAPSLLSLIVASVLAHILFFVADRDWVFTSTGDHRHGRTMLRFIIFMGFNFFLNILLIELFAHLLRQSPDGSIVTGLKDIWLIVTNWLTPLIGTMEQGWEMYVAQFLTGFVFTAWTFIGLRFWVFAPIQHHARTSRHLALNMRPKNKIKT